LNYRNPVEVKGVPIAIGRRKEKGRRRKDEGERTKEKG